MFKISQLCWLFYCFDSNEIILEVSILQPVLWGTVWKCSLLAFWRKQIIFKHISLTRVDCEQQISFSVCCLLRIYSFRYVSSLQCFIHWLHVPLLLSVLLMDPCCSECSVDGPMLLWVFCWWAHVALSVLLMGPCCSECSVDGPMLLWVSCWWAHVALSVLLMDLCCSECPVDGPMLLWVFCWWTYVALSVLLMDPCCSECSVDGPMLLWVSCWWTHVALSVLLMDLCCCEFPVAGPCCSECSVNGPMFLRVSCWWAHVDSLYYSECSVDVWIASGYESVTDDGPTW